MAAYKASVVKVAWEAAVSALRTVDLRPLLREFQQSSGER
jgi:hypothetical protein